MRPRYPAALALACLLYLVANPEIPVHQPEPWPADWPGPVAVVEHQSGWVCAYGGKRNHERFVWTRCKRGGETVEGIGISGGKL